MPADDLTDPSPATTFAHLDATLVLSRQIAELGIYPAVDPLDSTSRILDPNVVGRSTTNGARGAGYPAALQGAQGHHRHPGYGRAVGRRQAGRVPGAQDPAFPVPALLRRRGFTGSPGKYVSLKDTIAAFKAIVAGEYDHLPEQAFYMVGAIDEAVAKAENM